MSQGQEEPGRSAEGSSDEPRFLSVVVRSSTEAYAIQVSEGSTVGQLKEQAALRFGLSKDRILLVFAGKVLRSRETLLQHNIRDGLTVHLVVRKPDAEAALPDHNAATPPLALVSEVPAFLESAREDLAALLDVLSEMPGHFLSCPDLMRHIVQSPTMQVIVSEDRNCDPLVVAFLLAMATLLGVSACKEKPASMKAIAEALETPGAQYMLTSTKEMAVFLSEAPEFQGFAHNTPQFEQMMSFGGLRKLMAIYARLGGGLDAEVDSGLEEDPQEEARSFQQLIEEVVRVLSSPETQKELEERMLRHTIATNVSLRRLAEQNPQVGHLLSNPQVLEQIVSYIRNPQVRHEIDRQGERALKKLEGVPGGHSFLHHVYTEVEEPIWSMMEERAEGSPLGKPGAKRGHLPLGMENRSPLPDPWAPRQETPKAGRTRGAAEEVGPSKKRGGSASPEKLGGPSCSSSCSQDAETGHPIQGQADRTGSEEPMETHEGKADLTLEADSKEDAAEDPDGMRSEEPKETREGNEDLTLEADSEDGHDAAADPDRTRSEEPKETNEGKADLAWETDSKEDAAEDPDGTRSEEPKETREGMADLTLEADSEEDAAADPDRTRSEEPKETREGTANLTLEPDSEEDGHDAAMDTSTGSEFSSPQLLMKEGAEEESNTATNAFP